MKKAYKICWVLAVVLSQACHNAGKTPAKRPRLVRSISGANIVYLPHGEESSICNQCGGFDGIDYYFEIATKNMYRFFYYCNPKEATACYEAKTVLNFATLLEKEFNFTYTK